MKRTCLRTSLIFLIDTGAEYSVLPASFQYHPSLTQDRYIPRILAANHTPIRTFGRLSLTLKFEHLPNEFTWPFIVANVSSPIIGADFIHAFRLTIDLNNDKLCVSKILSISTSPVQNASINEPLNRLLDHFQDLFVHSLQGLPPMKMTDSLNVCHHIITTGPPVAS